MGMGARAANTRSVRVIRSVLVKARLLVLTKAWTCLRVTKVERFLPTRQVAGARFRVPST